MAACGFCMFLLFFLHLDAGAISQASSITRKQAHTQASLPPMETYKATNVLLIRPTFLPLPPRPSPSTLPPPPFHAVSYRVTIKGQLLCLQTNLLPPAAARWQCIRRTVEQNKAGLFNISPFTALIPLPNACSSFLMIG